MAYTFSSNSGRLTATASPLGLGQLSDFSVSLWVNGPSANPSTVVFSVSRSTETTATNNPVFNIQNRNGAVGFFLRGNVSNGSAWNDQTSGIAFDGTWHHICVTLAGAVSTVYIDGAAGTTSNSGTVPAQSGMNRLGIGVFSRGNLQQFFTGSVANIGVWSVALGGFEPRALSRGVSCDMVRPQSLVFHAPLINNINDSARNLTLTSAGSVAVSAHPRTYL
jgi:hypothetical protein